MSEDNQNPEDIVVSNDFSLEALLGLAMEQEDVVSDPVIEQGFNSPVPAYINIPQDTSKSYPKSVRQDSHIFIRGEDMIVLTEKIGDQTFRYYSNNLRLALIDVQQTQSGSKTVAARTMWPLTEDGQRDMGTEDSQPACRSLNGIGPLPRFIGKDIYDPRTGQVVKIGFDKSGAPYPDMQQVCSRCTFSQWLKDGKPPQPCKQTTGYIVWVAPQEMVKASPNGTFSVVTYPSVESGGMLARLNGNNTGIEIALSGRTEKQSGRMADGSPIKAFSSYYLKNGEYVRDYLDGNKPVPPAVQSFVIGIAKTKRASDFVPMLWGSAIKEELATGNVKYVVVEVPAYDVYPEGNPLNLGKMTKVFPLTMSLGKNNFTTANPTTIPVLALDTNNPLSDAEFSSFLKEKMRYNAIPEGATLTIREQMLGVEFTMTDGNARLNEYRIGVSSPTARIESGGIPDAEYVELTDDMD